MPTAVLRFASFAISAATLIVLALVAALATGAFSPAGAAPADDYEADAQLIAQVRGYAQETANGYEHVSRWIRVLKSFGALDEITAAEAQGFADQHLATRWNPVVEALQALEGGQVGNEPGQQLIADLRGYAGETQDGYEHVLRWFRALNTLGALEGMTAAEAQGYAERGWARWVPVAAALAELEAASAEPEQAVSQEPAPKATPPAELQVSVSASPAHPRVNEAVILSPAVVNAPEAGSPSYRWEIEGNGDWHPYGSRATLQYLAAQAESWTFRVTLTYDNGQSATSEPITVTWSEAAPNQAPVVNKRAEDYSWFTGQNNAPRGTLVSKQFYQIFVDPDGDELTYAVAITGGDSSLVDDLQVTTEAGRKPRSWPPYGTYYRVWFQADGEDDWKALRPTLPDRPVVTVTLTATDPDGLSASVSGDFVIGWESYPEVVSATTDGETIELAFDWPVESSPLPNPEQFTVRAVNEDGSSGSVGVNSVAVNGTIVTLELASALAHGQTVTLDYAYVYHLDSHKPLQRAGGGDHAPGFSGQAVEFLEAPGEPQNFSISAEAGELDLSATWDALDGVTFYQLRWRQSGGQFEAANASTVSDTNTTVTVSDYGQWEVRLQGCNEAGCGPEADGTVEVERVMLNSPENFAVSAEPGKLVVFARWQRLEGATSYNLRWRLAGGEFEANSTATVSDTVATITVSDYGQWEVWLQGCNDAGCGPEASRLADIVLDLQLNLTPNRDSEGNDRSRTITANWESVHGATSYTLRWWRAGESPPAFPPAPTGDSRRRGIADGSSGAFGEGNQRANSQGTNWFVIPAGQTSAEFTLPDDGAYLADLQARASGGNLVARGLNDVHLHSDQTDTTPPRMVRGEIDGGDVTIYFSEPLKEDAMGGVFYVQVQIPGYWSWTASSPEEIQISGNKVNFSFGGPLNSLRASKGLAAFTAYISWPADSTVESLQDLAGNVVSTPYPWSDDGRWQTPNLWLENLTDRDLTPPSLLSATASSKWLTLLYSEPLDEFSVPPASAFAVKRTPPGGSEEPVALSGPPTIYEDKVLITLASALLDTDTNVKVSYQPPASGSANRLKDEAGHDAPSFNDQTVGPDTTAPNLVRGTINRGRLTLYFSEPLDEQSWGSGGYFHLDFDYRPPRCFKTDSRYQLCGTIQLAEGEAELSGNRIVIDLAEHVVRWSKIGATVKTYYVRHTDSTGTVLQDLAGNSIKTPYDWGTARLRSRVIKLKNFTKSTALVNANVDREQVTLRFDSQLDQDSVPPADAFTILVDGTAARLAAARPVSVSGNAVTLTLASRVVSGDQVSVSYRRPSSESLRNTAKDDIYGFSNQPVFNSTSPFSVTDVEFSTDARSDRTYVFGEEIRVRLTFGSAVNVNTADGKPRLKIDFGTSRDSERWADYAGGHGTTMLEFAYSVTDLDRSLTGIAVLRDSLELNGGTIRSASSNESVDLRHDGLHADSNRLVDGVLPTLDSVTAAADGATITLKFSKTLDENSPPPASAFSVHKTPPGESETTVPLSGAPVIDGANVILTLADQLVRTDANVKVSYSKPAAGAGNRLRDLVGNEAEVFANRKDDTKPRLVRGEIDSGTVTLYFSESLNEDSVGGGVYVTLRSARGYWHSYSAKGKMQVSGNTVSIELGKGRTHDSGEVAKAYYYKPLDPDAERVRDLVGNSVWTPKSWGTDVHGNHRWGTRTINLDNLTAPARLERGP